MDDFEYLVNLFVDGVRCCLQLGGFAKRKEEQESAGAFLVGYRGGLYTIDSDYQVARAIDGIAAIGSGAQVAIGALSAMIAASERGVRESDRSISAGCECKDPIDRVNRDLSTRQKPEQILLTALAAAERWNSTVRRPFTVISDRERLNNPSIDISNRSRKIAQ